MNKLADIDPDVLRKALADATEAKTAKRLMVALAYRDGAPVETLSERYDIPKSTIYYWLDRFESRPVEEAVEDEDRPGRPSKLGEAEREKLDAITADSPSAYGFDEDAWTPESLQALIEREFGVSYSVGHVRRLLKTAADAD